MAPIETLPLPEDPTLAAYAAALNETGHWATVFDAQWRVAFVTDELRLSFGEVDSAVQRVGEHWFGPAELSRRKAMAFVLGDWMETVQRSFRRHGPFILFDTPGGRDELRRVVDPALVDLVDEIEPVEAPPVWRGVDYDLKSAGSGADTRTLFMRVHDRVGTFIGTIFLSKPRPGMSQLATATALADLDHLDRMTLVDRPDRRPAAVLMADLKRRHLWHDASRPRSTSHSVVASSVQQISASSTMAASSAATQVMVSSRSFSPRQPYQNLPQQEPASKLPEHYVPQSSP